MNNYNEHSEWEEKPSERKGLVPQHMIQLGPHSGSFLDRSFISQYISSQIVEVNFGSISSKCLLLTFLPRSTLKKHFLQCSIKLGFMLMIIFVDGNCSITGMIITAKLYSAEHLRGNHLPKFSGKSQSLVEREKL